MSDILAKVQVISPYLFDPSGRSARKQFLLSWLAILAVDVLVSFGVVLTFNTGDIDNAMRGVEFLSVAWFFIPAIRRCHDLEWSGWVSLLLLFPLATPVMLLLLAFKKGYVWNPSE